MKIKEQTKKLAAGCSKQCFEIVDETDEVSSKHGFEFEIELTKSVTISTAR
ncbi:N-ethylammeline chlorohydrolase [Streptococcus pneumoniae]|nr:N-ethylammeline chlorohydrolase [Streptococcus pneumoniae]